MLLTCLLISPIWGVGKTEAAEAELTEVAIGYNIRVDYAEDLPDFVLQEDAANDDLIEQTNINAQVQVSYNAQSTLLLLETVPANTATITEPAINNGTLLNNLGGAGDTIAFTFDDILTSEKDGDDAAWADGLILADDGGITE